MTEKLSFANNGQATVRTKKILREQTIFPTQVNSRRLPKGGTQTIIWFEQGTSDATFAKVVAVLTEAGYDRVSISARSCFVSACAGMPVEEKCLLEHGYVKPCQQDRGHAGDCDKETIGLVRKTGDVPTEKRVTLMCAKSFVSANGTSGVCAVRQEPGARGNHEGPHFDDQRRVWSDWTPKDVFKEKYLDALVFMLLLADQLEGSGDNALASDVRKYVRESNEL